MSNLWDVTDKDIDGMTERMLQLWQGTSSNKKTTAALAEALVEARKKCTLPYLTGSAMVIYAPLCGFFL